MNFVLGIVLFIVGIVLSVVLHELGHLLTANWCGMRVRRYFVGYGPTLFSRHWKGTEYGVKAIPLGGFCDIAGMTILDEDLTPEEEPVAMYKKPAWQRIVVLLGGITMNLLLGVVLIYVVAAAWGLPNLISPTVTRVGETSCVADQRADGSVASCSGAGPAATAGVRAGDIIDAVNSTPVSSPEDVISLTQKSFEGVTYTVTRGDRQYDFLIQPEAALRLVPSHPGADNTSGEKVLHSVPVTGISIRLEPLEPMKYYTPATAVPGALQFSWDINGAIVKAIVRIPAQIPGLVHSIFGGERSLDSPMSIVGASVAGGDALAFGSWSVFLLLLAQINFCLALFNLIPLPPLDGGHVAVVLYEKVRDGVLRLLGREPRGPADYSKLLPLTSIVVMLLVLLFVVTVAADIVNPIRLR